MATEKRFIHRISSRKWIAYIVGMTLATIHLYYNPDSFGEWRTFVIWLTGVYVGGNVLHRAAESVERNGKTQ